ncbi:MAG: hypothetical protein K2Y56_07510 [Methylobacterium sp.]|uniref:hypothetical protein n=1 Tax=Methylobacterium sp. TaxID=409 RepID=UPI0025F3552D|nr:hypothetical protein [Methylobacterium sp.]MBX9931370.1 hypothetical protein [Methylobacterium sp.]
MTPSLRLARAKRLVAVQEQMRRLAERDLAATRRDIAGTEVERAGLLRVLSEERMQGLFLDAASSHLRRIAGRAAELKATASSQEANVLACGLAEKRTERWAKGLAKELHEEEGRRDVQEQLDLLVARGDASLP